MLNRTIAPQSNAIEQIHLLEPQHKTLGNGCQLYWFDSGGQELVRIEWVFANLRFDPARPLLNLATNTLLTEGTSRLTASQIAEQVDYCGAFLQADYGFDHSQVTLYTLNKHLGATLPVIKDMITDSVYPEKELQTYIRNQQQKLQVSLQKNDMVARRLFNKAVYGNTLYGLTAEAEDYQQLNQEDLLAHFKQMYQPGNCTLFVAGKIDDGLLAQLETMFGDEWPAASAAADITQPEAQSATEHFYFKEKPGALQSAIRMGTLTINRTHPDFPALQVLNTVLGGYFGSRLMANIREDKGYTYGIGSGVTSLKQCGSLFIASEVGADVCRDAVKEIEKEINLLRTELITEEELSLVRNYMLGSLLGSLENVFSHADKFKNVFYSGLNNAYYSSYTEVVKTVTAEELQRLANTYLNFDGFYKVIAGKY